MNLDITPELAVNEVVIMAAEVWATAQDQQDVAEAVGPYAVDEMTEKLNAARVCEMQDSGDDATVRWAGAPPPYVELSSKFVPLESAAAGCGHADAAFYLQKARMTFANSACLPDSTADRCDGIVF